MTIKIIKVKLKDRTFILDYVETLDDNTERRHKGVECDQLVHQDAINAIAKLKIHLVKLCDLHEGKNLAIDSDDETVINFNPEEHLKNFEVGSFSISGSDENEGVCISGHKELKSGKVINFTTPFTMYQDEDDEYEYGDELALSIQSCIYEAEQYFFHGKYAVKQTKIDFDTDVNAERSEDELLEAAKEEFKQATGALNVEITVETKKSRTRKLNQTTAEAM